MYKISKNKKTTNKKRRKLLPLPLIIAVAAILVLGAAGSGLYLYQKNQGNKTESLESEAADPDFSGGSEREPSKSTEKNGSVRDTEGEESNPGEQQQNDPIVSESGRIAVYMPREGQLLKSGDIVSGTAEVERVWYRLIDDQVGNLTQGSLAVVDGKFSGEFEFDTTATEGRLDIFSTTEDGVETDNIQIDIRFK